MKITRVKNATMTVARYRATIAKLQAAYDALESATETAEYFDGQVIWAARAALRKAADVLRVQVCDRCNPHGNYTAPEDPYTAYSCGHPGVPYLAVRSTKA